MDLVRRPTAKSGRYRRWIAIGWRPIPHAGKSEAPDQDRFLLKLRVLQRPGEEADAWASTGEGSDIPRPHMEIQLTVQYDPDRSPRCLGQLCAAIHQTVRHEIEHLLDEGYLALPGPSCRACSRGTVREPWQKGVRLCHWRMIRRRLFGEKIKGSRSWSHAERRMDDHHSTGHFLGYMMCARELHPFAKGFQAEARFRRVEWDVPALEYVGSMVAARIMSEEEGEAAMRLLVMWATFVLPHAPIREETLLRYL
jgi:hypothetical protein